MRYLLEKEVGKKTFVENLCARDERKRDDLEEVFSPHRGENLVPVCGRLVGASVRVPNDRSSLLSILRRKPLKSRTFDDAADSTRASSTKYGSYEFSRERLSPFGECEAGGERERFYFYFLVKNAFLSKIENTLGVKKQLKRSRERERENSRVIFVPNHWKEVNHGRSLLTTQVDLERFSLFSF